MLQPFEPELNWTRFSVSFPQVSQRCWGVVLGGYMTVPNCTNRPTVALAAPSAPQADIPRLHEILSAISADRYKEMQANLGCAAQHMTWSTTIGSFMRESGAYDAFETLLEILRVRLLHPKAKPEEYAKLDADFAAFERCASPHARVPPPKPQPPHGADSKGPPNRTFEGLCSLSKYDRPTPGCKECMSTHRGYVPGGALCCETSENLAACPRLWA